MPAAWQPITSMAAFDAARAAPGVAMVLWGGVHCGVCQAVKPKLLHMVAQHFPQVALHYVDCTNAPEVCAQQGVFSLPVLRVFAEGTLAQEYARAFSVQQVQADVQRLLDLGAA